MICKHIFHSFRRLVGKKYVNPGRFFFKRTTTTPKKPPNPQTTSWRRNGNKDTEKMVDSFRKIKASIEKQSQINSWAISDSESQNSLGIFFSLFFLRSPLNKFGFNADVFFLNRYSVIGLFIWKEREGAGGGFCKNYISEKTSQNGARKWR